MCFFCRFSFRDPAVIIFNALKPIFYFHQPNLLPLQKTLRQASPFQSSHPASWKIPAGSLTCECWGRQREGGRGSRRLKKKRRRREATNTSWEFSITHPAPPPHLPQRTNTDGDSLCSVRNCLFRWLRRILNNISMKKTLKQTLKGQTMCNTQLPSFTQSQRWAVKLPYKSQTLEIIYLQESHYEGGDSLIKGQFSLVINQWMCRSSVNKISYSS